MSQLSLFTGRRSRVKDRRSREFELHCMVADILRRWGTRGWLTTHFPSGEKRNPTTGARLKRMGLKRGMPDFWLVSPYPARLHLLELKRPGGKLTEEQAEVQQWCRTNEVPYAVADNFNAALAVLRDWGAVRASVSA